MRADNASAMKAKNSMLMAAAQESVNILSAPTLILSVIGIPAEAADINR